MSGEDVQKKKRRWGKSRPKEEVTVINKDDLEETLSKCAQEAKEAQERKSKNIVISQTSSNQGNVNAPFSAIDLQQPQLMSNERLIQALKKINVPIPVYPDGSPSRERLLYLYRTFVLPQPQRKKQLKGRQRWSGGKRKNGSENMILESCKRDCWDNGETVEEMEVETSDNTANNAEIGKKRMSSCESQEKDLMPPIKKLLIKSPSTESASFSQDSSGPRTTSVTTPTPPSAPVPTIKQHKIIRVKRSSTSSMSSSPTSTSTAVIKSTEHSSTSHKNKIMWP